MSSLSAKVAGLTFIPAGVVGISQFHYVVSHLSTIATGATAIGLGVAVWGGHSVVGKIKGLRKPKGQPAPEAVAQPSVDEQAQAWLDSLRHELPQTSLDERLAQMRHRSQVIDYTAAGQEVTRVRKV